MQVKGQGHNKVKNIHNMLSDGDTTICKNLVCPCQRAKTSCQTQIHGENNMSYGSTVGASAGNSNLRIFDPLL